MNFLTRLILVILVLFGLYIGYVGIATHLALRQEEAKSFSERDLEDSKTQASYQNCLRFPDEVKDSSGVILATPERFCLCYAVNEVDYLNRGLIQAEEIHLGQDPSHDLVFQVAQTCRQFFRGH